MKNSKEIKIKSADKPEEIPEVKSLRWLANMFPYIEHPIDETDKMSNAIHLYCSRGDDKIVELSILNKQIQEASHA